MRPHGDLGTWILGHREGCPFLACSEVSSACSVCIFEHPCGNVALDLGADSLSPAPGWRWPVTIVGQKERQGTWQFRCRTHACRPRDCLFTSCTHFCWAFGESRAPELGMRTGCLWTSLIATLCPFQQERQDGQFSCAPLDITPSPVKPPACVCPEVQDVATQSQPQDSLCAEGPPLCSLCLHVTFLPQNRSLWTSLPFEGGSDFKLPLCPWPSQFHPSWWPSLSSHHSPSALRFSVWKTFCRGGA